MSPHLGDLLADADTATFILRRVERWEQRGDGYVALCPVHADRRTPNLHVSPGDQVDWLVHCFACGAGYREVIDALSGVRPRGGVAATRGPARPRREFDRAEWERALHARPEEPVLEAFVAQRCPALTAEHVHRWWASRPARTRPSSSRTTTAPAP